MGETSKLLAERFGKIAQVKQSVSVNRNDVSVSKSSQMDFAIPQSKIAALSSGEFVGMVADNPDQRIKLKSFHCEIANDPPALKKNEQTVIKEGAVKFDVTKEMIQSNYRMIKEETLLLVEREIERLLAESKD
jgi:hypothetical protein